jgi:hypothetical protein
VTYLEKKGHLPTRVLSGGKLAYNCPLPDHSESRPSFIVWTQGEFENFYCFGCHRKYHIIHLVSLLEGISFKQAVGILGDGIEISIDEDLDIILKNIDKVFINSQSNVFELSKVMISISSMCYSYLEGVNFHRSEVSIINKMWSAIDKHTINFEFDEIESMLDYLPKVLKQRRKKYDLIRREEDRANYASR